MHDHEIHPGEHRARPAHEHGGAARSEGSRRATEALRIQRTAGNRALCSTLMRIPADPAPQVADLAGSRDVDVSEKDDAILARGIVDGELGILRQWRDALLIFDKNHGQ